MHGELYQHFAFSILFCPTQTALEITLSEPRILCERLDQVSFKENHEFSFAWTEPFPFPFGTTAHHRVLDWIFFYFASTISRSLNTD